MNSSRAHMMLIVAALMWSLGGLFIKLVDLHPISISGIRSLGAALLLFIYISKPKWHWNRYFVIGVLSYCAMVMFYVIAILFGCCF